MKYYMLEGKTLISTTDHLAWAAWFKDTNRRVTQTPVSSDIEVSTVFMGLDHNFSNEGPPILFETMVFGGPLDQEQARYATWEEAEAGHKAMVEMVKKEATEAK